jgi:GTPase
MAKLVGKVSQMLAEMKKAEAEEEAHKKQIEFSTEAAIRTEGFQTTSVTNITQSDGEDVP